MIIDFEKELISHGFDDFAAFMVAEALTDLYMTSTEDAINLAKATATSYSVDDAIKAIPNSPEFDDFFDDDDKSEFAPSMTDMEIMCVIAKSAGMTLFGGPEFPVDGTLLVGDIQTPYKVIDNVARGKWRPMFVEGMLVVSAPSEVLAECDDEDTEFETIRLGPPTSGKLMVSSIPHEDFNSAAAEGALDFLGSGVTSDGVFLSAVNLENDDVVVSITRHKGVVITVAIELEEVD